MTGEQKPGGLEVVEGESVAIMRPFWVSWWGEPGTFELHRPWWISGERDDGKQSICAAVLAQDEFTARLSIQWAHDDNDAVIEWRFAEEKPKGWSPFGSRFRQADWMIWPESLTPAEPAEARIRSLEAELEDAKTVDSGLWDWLCERDLQPDRVEFEWSDVVVALTEHETNAYDLAEKAEARATAAEAKLARAVEGLEAIAAHKPFGDGSEYRTDYQIGHDNAGSYAADVARQTLAALQQGTADQ